MNVRVLIVSFCCHFSYLTYERYAIKISKSFKQYNMPITFTVHNPVTPKHTHCVQLWVYTGHSLLIK